MYSHTIPCCGPLPIPKRITVACDEDQAGHKTSPKVDIPDDPMIFLRTISGNSHFMLDKILLH
jgi:hypothetical protein